MKNKLSNYNLQRQQAQKHVTILHRNFLKSRTIFLVLNIALIIMSAFMGILSAYSIAKNQHLPSVAIFVSIAFITAIIAFFNTLMVTLALNNKFQTTKSRIATLKAQLEQLRKGEISDMKSFLTDVAGSDIID